MVRMLVGPEGGFITGQTIHVNGGAFLDLSHPDRGLGCQPGHLVWAHSGIPDSVNDRRKQTIHAVTACLHAPERAIARRVAVWERPRSRAFTIRATSTTPAASASWPTSRAGNRTTSSRQGLQILVNLDHRGAVGADPLVGDGAGCLIQIPDAPAARLGAKARA